MFMINQALNFVTANLPLDINPDKVKLISAELMIFATVAMNTLYLLQIKQDTLLWIIKTTLRIHLA